VLRVPAVAFAASLLLALPAHAAPQVTDPRGDALTGSPGADIVSVQFSARGAGARRALAVAVTYAGAPDPLVSHQVTFTSPACGEVYVQAFPNGTLGDAECLGDERFEVAYSVAGDVLTFVLPFAPVRLRRGAVLRDLTAYTAVSDPALGYESQEVWSAVAAQTGLPGSGAVDMASSDATFRIP
jgi:hypothetical protein